MTKKKETLFILLLCFLAAVFFVAFESYDSFLYPTQIWIDDNLFLTVARSLMAGKRVYVDVFDHKGFYLYVVEGVMWSFFPNAGNPFIGIYFVEVIAATMFLFAVYKITTLYTNTPWIRLVVPMLTGAFTYGAYCFDMGGAVEEYMLPFFAYGIYTFIKYFKYGEKPYPTFFINGLMAGFAIWWKFTFCGFWIGWCSFIGISIWVKDGFLPAFKRMLLVLGAMALISLPALYYFISNGTFSEMIRIYFKMNMSGYAEPMGIREKIKTWIFIAWANRAQLSFVIIGLTLFVLRNRWLGVFTTGLFFTMLFFLYFGAMTHKYYFIPVLTFYSIAFLECSLWIERGVEWAMEQKLPIAKVKRVLDRGTMAIILAFLVGLIGMFALRTEDQRSRTKGVSSAMELADVIRREQATLLCYYSYDWGVYVFSDTLPINRHYCIVNITYYRFPEMMKEQWKMVEEEATDFVLTCEWQLPDEDGQALLEEHYEFYCSSDRGGIPLTLWKRK